MKAPEKLFVLSILVCVSSFLIGWQNKGRCSATLRDTGQKLPVKVSKGSGDLPQFEINAGELLDDRNYEVVFAFDRSLVDPENAPSPTLSLKREKICFDGRLEQQGRKVFVRMNIPAMIGASKFDERIKIVSDRQTVIGLIRVKAQLTPPIRFSPSSLDLDCSKVDCKQTRVKVLRVDPKEEGALRILGYSGVQIGISADEFSIDRLPGFTGETRGQVYIEGKSGRRYSFPYRFKAQSSIKVSGLLPLYQVGKTYTIFVSGVKGKVNGKKHAKRLFAEWLDELPGSTSVQCRMDRINEDRWKVRFRFVSTEPAKTIRVGQMEVWGLNGENLIVFPIKLRV